MFFTERYWAKRYLLTKGYPNLVTKGNSSYGAGYYARGIASLALVEYRGVYHPLHLAVFACYPNFVRQSNGFIDEFIVYAEGEKQQPHNYPQANCDVNRPTHIKIATFFAFI
jgi:hypothetical protein